MLPKIWSLLMLGSVIDPLLAAKICSRSYVNGKWITEGECGGPEKMSAMLKDLQLGAENEKKKKRIADKKWTVFQRRKYGNVDFFRGWGDYVNGFGNRDGDFWLGLATMHQMTKEGNMEMKIKMISTEGVYLVAKYSSFRIGPGSDLYRLHVSGYSGNATRGGLAYHNNRQFSTKDADNDGATYNCAHLREGGWWFDRCGSSNLNGNFYATGLKGMYWWGDADGDGRLDTRYNLRCSEMRFRMRM